MAGSAWVRTGTATQREGPLALVVGKEPARCVSTRVDHPLRNSYVTESPRLERIPLRPMTARTVIGNCRSKCDEPSSTRN